MIMEVELRRGRHQTPMTINKWAKPLPKLDLPARVHLQKASKIKQIWELWSVDVALAMSTWTDVAVAYRHQVYTQSEDSYQQWRRSGMADRFAYEKRYLYGRKAPVPATCDSVEALLRHELLAHIPEWLARKAGDSRLYQFSYHFVHVLEGDFSWLRTQPGLTWSMSYTHCQRRCRPVCSSSQHG